MRIVGETPTPGSRRFDVVCWCGFPFTTTGDNRGVVKCPKCRREGRLRTMIETWKATSTEKLAKLKELSAKSRALYEEWADLPELEKAKPRGREIATKLEQYLIEAQALVDELNEGD